MDEISLALLVLVGLGGLLVGLAIGFAIGLESIKAAMEGY